MLRAALRLAPPPLQQQQQQLAQGRGGRVAARVCMSSTASPSSSGLSLVLYSKPGCHLCEGLEEKLQAVQQTGQLNFTMHERNITTNPKWFEAYKYDIPVMTWLQGDGTEVKVPRASPRSSVDQLARHLQKSLEAGQVAQSE
eukprot:jgi/Chlat1/1417/Chrsp12S01988